MQDLQSFREEHSAAEWTATIFAKNEERTIRECVESVRAQGDVVPLVLVNGSTDRTAQLAEQAGARVIKLTVASKSSAWNEAVHKELHAASVHFFIDAYAIVTPGSFAAMAAKLAEHPKANACSAIPRSGRSRKQLAAAAMSGALHGSLHALAGHFVERIQARGIRLPAGIYRGDGLINTMALHNLDPSVAWDRSLVVCAPEAGWTFRGLSPFSISDWKRWYARRRNQKRGAAENQRIKEVIYSKGFEALQFEPGLGVE